MYKSRCYLSGHLATSECGTLWVQPYLGVAFMYINDEGVKDALRHKFNAIILLRDVFEVKPKKQKSGSMLMR